MQFFAAALDTRLLGAHQAKAKRVFENTPGSAALPFAARAPGALRVGVLPSAVGVGQMPL